MTDNQGIKESTEQTNEVKKLNDEIKDIVNKNILEDGILKNFLEFDVEGKKYKINRPTTAQKNEAYQKKVTYYMKLMKLRDDEGNYIYYPEKQLRKIYKERGIDIEALEASVQSLEKQKTDYQEKLGKALVDNIPENQLDIFKNEIVKLNDEILDIYMQKNSLLEYSLENQSMAFLYEYLTYLITSVQNEKGEYIKAFNSFEDFRNLDSSISNTIGIHAGMLLGSL